MIRLALASIRHRLGLQAGVMLGVALATALIVAGLAMGDTLRASLQGRVTARLGPVVEVVAPHDRRFADDLDQRVADASGRAAAALLALDGVARAEGAGVGVALLGAGPSLGSLAPSWSTPAPGEALLAPGTAAALGAGVGDRVVVRVERPGALPREAAIMQADDRIAGIALTVAGVLDPAWPAALGWQVTPDAPANIFVDRAWLQAQLDLGPEANLLLVGAGAAPLDAALGDVLTLADAQLTLAQTGGELALVAGRILMDDAVVRAAEAIGGTPASTWFIDTIAKGDARTAYAFVTALGGADRSVAVTQALPDLDVDDVAISAWTAERLGAEVGHAVTLRIPVLGPSRALDHVERELTVAAVVPMAAPFTDDTWMPPYEGLAGKESCREWDPGIPVDLDRITDADEAYWEAYGGAPKAWVSLALAEATWASSFGVVTQVRFEDGRDAGDVRAALLQAVRPADVGLTVRPVASTMTAAAAPANDFGLLFLGFEVVLVGASLALSGLLFSFSLLARAREVGTLRAVGWPVARIRRLLLTEGALVAVVGAGLGAVASVPLVWALLAGLQGVWRGAVGDVSLPAVLLPGTVATGVVASLVVAVAALGWTTRSLLAREPRTLLSGDTEADVAPPARWLVPASAVAAAAALAIVAVTPLSRSPEGALAFFGAGFAVLVAGGTALRATLGRGLDATPRSLAGLAWRGASRRPGRSVAVALLLGGGAFLVVGVGLGGGQGRVDPTEVTSGTGGYDLYVETTLPVVEDLDSDDGRDAYALRPEQLPDGSVLAVRRLDGDDASCLQLGSAQAPVLLGVDAAALEARGAFSRADGLPGDPWAQLAAPRSDGRVAALGDVGTVTWGLHAAPGHVLTYQGRDGRTVEVEIVGVLANTVFQGGLLVDDAALRAHFSGADGARVLLVDAPASDTAAVLSRALADLGAAVQTTERRLDRFAEVEHTYVAIFHVLGGLGLVLGALGVGIVLARGVLEREAELALLHAVGFPRHRVARLLVLEHLGLVAAGLTIGTASAAVAVLPMALSPDAQAPWGTAVAVILGTGAVALLGIVVGANRALARSSVAALADRAR